MRASSRRPEQVGETVRQVIAEALAREVRDPRVGFVTVTGVLVTQDLSHARVMVSVPGDEPAQTRALEGLQSAAGFLRTRAARTLSTRTVPELHFELDGAAARRPDQRAARRHPARGDTLIGAVLVDKPAGLTSHDVVQRARRVLGTRAVGHTGTLDPFATGLLVILVGRATRLARFVEAERKTYLATARLGVATDTDDLTGRPLGDPVDTSRVAAEDVRRALGGFVGERRQRPPSYSAKHVEGERSYRLARRGAPVSPPAAVVTVHAIDVVGVAGGGGGLPGHGERRHLPARAGARSG